MDELVETQEAGGAGHHYQTRGFEKVAASRHKHLSFLCRFCGSCTFFFFFCFIYYFFCLLPLNPGIHYIANNQF